MFAGPIINLKSYRNKQESHTIVPGEGLGWPGFPLESGD